MSNHRRRRLDRDAAGRQLPGVPAGPDAADGRHAGGDALAGLLASAAGPARPHELAGEHAARAAFRAAGLAGPRASSTVRSGLTRLLTVKMAAIVTGTVASGVALAATVGVLPNPLDSDVRETNITTQRGARSAPTGSRLDVLDTTPSPALVGLCQYYLAAPPGDHGRTLESPAFDELVNTAGGKDKVDAYCARLLATSSVTNPTDHPSVAADPDDKLHRTGPPNHESGAPTAHPSGEPSPRPRR
jgi:hypothetical protein